MLKVLTAEQMRNVDRLTTERYGIPSILLMENAAHAVARVITENLGGSVKGKSILILCGKGNNGGDGAAIGRLLCDEGAKIRLILFAKLEETKGDARANFDRLQPEIEVCEAEEWWQAWEYINPLVWDDLSCVVDAVFGTGLKYYRDDFNEIIGSFANVPHISVDIPSGLMADSGDVQPTQFMADITVTFTSPKIGNVLQPAGAVNGELIVANIGSPQELIDGQPSQLYLTEKEDVDIWLKNAEFSSGDYKNKRGHSLVIAGSENYSGAAVLAGNAAMRSGVGLVTVVTPRSSKDSVASRLLPEVMVRGASETESGSISEDAFDEIGDLLEKADSIAIGCGLSQHASTKAFIEKVIESRRQPVIVDADALNLLSPYKTENHPDAKAAPLVLAAEPSSVAGTPQPRKEGSVLILTPHEGEFMRLLGTEDKDVIKDRVAAVRDFAVMNNVILVLKGERVLIGSPDGRVVVNPTGNSGLGKAGNGDTLAGILTGFVAQAVRFEIDIFETVVAAVYVAGMAGDIAEKKYGTRVMTASDVRECLTETFADLAGN